MKKVFYLIIVLALILIAYAITDSYAKYYKILKSNAASISSQNFESLTGTLTQTTEGSNTYNLAITNSNSYSVQYKLKEKNNLATVTFPDSQEEYKTIAAKTSETIQVTFNEYDNKLYKDSNVDTSGNLYTNINIELEGTKPYKQDAVQIATNIKLYLKKNLKNNVIAQEEEVNEYEEDTTFTGVSDSSEKSLCTIIDPVSGEKIYFYRGAVDNNYVKFAGYTWRILRINADGSFRIVLDSIATTSAYTTSNTPTSNTIESAIDRINWQNSTAYTALHNWYNNNIANYSEYVIQSKYVFDTTYEDSTSTTGGGSCYYFNAYLRVGSDKSQYQPTFAYNDENVVNDYVGLLTGDEIVYAGGHWNTNNTSYFLYNPSITTDTWTISPSFFDNNSHHKIGMMVLGSTGKLHDWPDSGNTLTETLGLRPVISIRGDIEMTGTGTATDPYQYK